MTPVVLLENLGVKLYDLEQCNLEAPEDSICRDGLQHPRYVE